MKKATISIYKYPELPTDKAKEKARQWWSDCVTNEEWSEQTYEDASNVGIKIVGFDIDRGDFCAFDDSFDADEVYAAIIKDHGEHCETYKCVYAYNYAKEATLKQAPSYDVEALGEDILDDKLDVLAKALKESLQAAYLVMLRESHTHYFSAEHVSDNIEMNRYNFLEDGTHSDFEPDEETEEADTLPPSPSLDLSSFDLFDDHFSFCDLTEGNPDYDLRLCFEFSDNVPKDRQDEIKAAIAKILIEAGKVIA